MSALGHEQTSRHVRVMSVIALKADIHQRGLHVHLVPIADLKQRATSRERSQKLSRVIELIRQCVPPANKS